MADLPSELRLFIEEVDAMPPHIQELIHADRLRERLAKLEAAPITVGDDGRRKVTKEWIEAFWPVIEAIDDALALLSEHAL